MVRLEARKARIGFAERFLVGERDRVARLLDDLAKLDVRDVRLAVSWADYLEPAGRRFYDWLLPTLAERVHLVPCVAHTPPSLGIEPRSSAPPREPRAFSDWLEGFLARHGECFGQIELWNAPNSLARWDARLDPDLGLFAKMIASGADVAHAAGKRTVLGGLRPADTTFVRRLARFGILRCFDAFGVHAQPDLSEPDWIDFRAPVTRMRAVLAELDIGAQVWITEAGYSTWRHDEGRQARELLDALDSDADRLYWASMHDLHERAVAPSGFHVDEREYALGLKRADGSPKLLFRLWSEGGVENVRAHASVVRPRIRPRTRATVITGGAGFVGSNLAHALLERGETVLLLDNLDRPGVELNVRWLSEVHGDRVRLELGDVRDPFVVQDAIARADRVYHFAAQVAVTRSLLAPRRDFAVNAEGTLNVLEALRLRDDSPPVLFTSTNKVYGALPNVALQVNGERYEPCDPSIRANGISESRALDFHSPYGCSKGVADQYLLDYARSFDLRAVVFRMSCIYGPRQVGNEEQGWVAHFLANALRRAPIRIFGDGMQVRDVLFVGDLVEALLLAMDRIDDVRGHAFNVGGGPAHTMSLLELLSRIGRLIGTTPRVELGPWRPGDQRYYCSDVRKLERAIGWRPRTTIDEGLARLHAFLEPAPILASASGGKEG